MMDAVPAVLVASSTLAQLCAGWMAVLPIAALAIYGWYRGGFLATIACLQVIGSFLAAVALAWPASGILESLGCPASQSLAAAYVLVFVVGIVAVRLAVGATVPDGAVRLVPIVDQVGGVAVGALAGALLGGALLVGWSMADMPAWIRLDNTHQPLDTGGRVLWIFARFAPPGPGGWRVLLDGDPPASDAAAPGAVRGSEPFADANANRRRDAGPTADSGEAYVDVDRDGAFTADMRWIDVAGDGRRDVGLRDAYRLADWRRARVLHAPVIVSDDKAEVVENAPVEEPVYQARATDADGDTVTFTIEPAGGSAATEGDAGEQAPGLVVDPATGAVTLVEPADFEVAKTHEFVVVATDAAGLTDRKTVRIRVRDVLVEPPPVP